MTAIRKRKSRVQVAQEEHARHSAAMIADENRRLEEERVWAERAQTPWQKIKNFFNPQ